MFGGIWIVIVFVVFLLHVDEDSLSHELPNSVENFAPREVSTDFPAEAMPVNMRSFFKNEETGKEVDKKCQ